MSRFRNLAPAEQAQVNSRLAELRKKTGRSWDYSVTKAPGICEKSPLLEIIVDGRIAQPVVLPETAEFPAEIVCTALENHARKLAPQ